VALSERQVAGLLADTRRVVAAEESLGWVTDKIEFEDVYPTLLKSLCRTAPPAREAAMARLEGEKRAAGDPAALFQRASGEITDEVRAALSASRRLGALGLANERGRTECPFWIPVDTEFEGLQTDRNRLTFNVESGGVFLLRAAAAEWTVGGGGFARLLSAWGFNGRWTLLLGPEFGGGALVRPSGDEGSGVSPTYIAATPIIGRIRDLAWHYDVELAPVGLFETNNTRVSYGARVATTIGFSALFTQSFIPWAGASLGYEYYFEGGGRPTTHFLRGGLRAGLSWDP